MHRVHEYNRSRKTFVYDLLYIKLNQVWEELKLQMQVAIHMWIACYPFGEELSSCIHNVPAIYMKLLFSEEVLTLR